MVALASALAANQAQTRLALTAAQAVVGLPLPRALRALAMIQRAAATVAIRSVVDILDEQGIDAAAVALADPRAFSGYTAAGVPLEQVLTSGVPDWQKALFAQDVVHDAARQAAKAAMYARPAVSYYVRQTDGAACSRCAILAGRVYRLNEGFLRHPKCGCTHVPSTRAGAQSLVQTPREHFDSLTREQQDASFGKKNAQAIRDGADPAKVVNAYRDAWQASAKTSPDVIARRAATRDQGIEALRRLGMLR